MLSETFYMSMGGPYTIERTYMTAASSIAWVPSAFRDAVPVRTGYTGANAVTALPTPKCAYRGRYAFSTRAPCLGCGANDYTMEYFPQ